MTDFQKSCHVEILERVLTPAVTTTGITRALRSSQVIQHADQAIDVNIGSSKPLRGWFARPHRCLAFPDEAPATSGPVR
jgi:hypothetical protein